MKKTYESPELEVVLLEDVIATSSDPTDPVVYDVVWWLDF